MRGLGEFQKSQMKRTDTRIVDLFRLVRSAIDVLEDIMLHPYRPPAETEPVQIKPLQAPSNPAPEKMAYTIKDIRQLVGLGHTTIYQAIAAKELRAVKFGHRTLVLAADLQAWIASKQTL